MNADQGKVIVRVLASVIERLVQSNDNVRGARVIPSRAHALASAPRASAVAERAAGPLDAP